MAVTLEQIRAIVIREVGNNVEHESIMNWCNDLNIDVGNSLNVPADTFEISITTTDLSYSLPADLKEINRLWLQSDYDGGLNKELSVPYRIYNGTISFPIAFPVIDTLNVDYYKFLTFFTDQTDEIDFPDRFMTLYTAFCKMRYYELYTTQTQITVPVATRNYESASQMYQMVRNQIIQNYSFTNPDLSIKERW